MTGRLLRSAYVETHSPEATEEVGRALAGVVREGDVLVLTGDLGAGKTRLTKGLAAGLGVTDEVTSPTFTIQSVHEGGRMPLYHFDLYRLDDASQLGDAGLYDVLGADGVCAIEWGEGFADEIGEERVDVTVSRMDDEVAGGVEPPRRITFAAHEEFGERLVGALAEALERLGVRVGETPAE